MSRVLIIPDLHYPVAKEGHLDFLLSIYDSWECDTVVAIGDLVDCCALSFHTKNPRLKDPMVEYEKAREDVAKLVERFPVATLLVGNHDALPYRWCKEVGIPDEFMRSPSDLWGLPEGWDVVERFGHHEIDGVLYAHGDRGRASAILNAKEEFKSVVQGHHHSKAGITFFANKFTRIFGMQVGCLVDHTTLAQKYGQKYNSKPILGCGVVLDGKTPIFEPWILENE